MNAKDLGRAKAALDGLHDAITHLKLVRNTQESAYLTLHYKSSGNGYMEKFSAQNGEVVGIAKAYFERSFQKLINHYARELRGLGVEIPEELNKYVTDYPMRG